MLLSLTSLPAEAASALWFTLHRSQQFAIRATELHYFQSLAIALDDDLAALLLLKKLKLSGLHAGGTFPSDRAELNSLVEFRVDGGDRRRARLARRCSDTPGLALDAGSRLGIGLLGLRPGQRILWPDEQGDMLELELLGVENGDRALPRPARPGGLQ